MTQTLSFPARDETVVFDRSVLSALCEAHGAGIEAYLTAKLTELNALLDLARVQHDARADAGLYTTCEALASLAGAIGMTGMPPVAAAVREAIAAGDRAAVAACCARMQRMGRPGSVACWTVRQDTVA